MYVFDLYLFILLLGAFTPPKAVVVYACNQNLKLYCPHFIALGGGAQLVARNHILSYMSISMCECLSLSHSLSLVLDGLGHWHWQSYNHIIGGGHTTISELHSGTQIDIVAPKPRSTMSLVHCVCFFSVLANTGQSFRLF